jgi:hypothetical protein
MQDKGWLGLDSITIIRVSSIPWNMSLHGYQKIAFNANILVSG